MCYTEIKGSEKVIKRLADALTKLIYSYINAPPEMADLYRYGFEITISSLLNIGKSLFRADIY